MYYVYIIYILKYPPVFFVLIYFQITNYYLDKGNVPLNNDEKWEFIIYYLFKEEMDIIFKIFFKQIKIICLIRIVPRIIQMQLVITKGWFLVQLLEIVQQLFLPIFFYRASIFFFRAKI